jgi:AbiTii
MSKFSQLIDDAADQKSHSLSDVMLKAKVLAHHLKSRKFRQWVNAEIDGYDSKMPLPDYRVLHATLMGDFAGPFQSQLKNVSLSTTSLEPAAKQDLGNQPLIDGISYIEDLLSREGDVGQVLDYKTLQYLRVHAEQVDGMILNRVVKHISKHGLAGLLSGVRSRLLDFLLELRDKHPALDKNDDEASRIAEDEIDLAMSRKVYKNCTVFEGAEMRDVYQAGQAGAMGPNSKAENINFIQVLRNGIGDSSLADLASELEQLRGTMLSESKTADQDKAVAAIAEAEAAAKKGDAKGVLGWLKEGGKWALDVATKIGVSVASKAIETAMTTGA